MKFSLGVIGFCVSICVGMTACGGSGSRTGAVDSNGSQDQAPGPQTFAGAVDGLKSDGLVLTDGVQDVSVGALDTSFKFPQSSDGARSLTIKSQPTNPSSVCAITGSDASDKKVSCTYVPRFVYAVNYLTSDIRQFSIDAATGAMTFVRSVPWDSEEDSRASDQVSVAVHPFKGVLYVTSPRTHQTTTYSIDPRSGYLIQSGDPVDAPLDRFGRLGGESELGVTPRGSFAYALNNQPSSIDQYRVNAETGLLEYIGNTLIDSMDHVVVASNGKWLFSSQHEKPSLYVYSLDPATGAVGVPALTSTGIANDVAVHPNGTLLYIAGTNPLSSITPYQIRADGTLVAKPGNAEVGAPNLSYVDAAGSRLVSANGTQIAAQKILSPTEGSLGPASFITTPSEADQLVLWPDGKFIFAAYHFDGLPLGLYAVDAGGAIRSLAVPTEISNTSTSTVALY